jgi:putative FmdB family regulatory protein
MPIYEYQCLACERKFEKLMRHNDTPHCPACDSENVKKRMSGFAFRSKSLDGTVTTSMAAADGCDSCTRTSCTGCH